MLSEMAETINSTGRRKIAKLEMSVADPDVLNEKTEELIAQAEKAGSMTSRQTSEGDEELTDFDIDVFTKDYRLASSNTRKKEHVFGRVETSRGEWNLSENESLDRHRDRFNEGPALQRYVTSRLIRPP
jgi:hypothetical protein